MRENSAELDQYYQASPEVRKAAAVVAKLRKVGIDRAQEAATTLCALSRVSPEAIKKVDGFIYVVAIIGHVRLPMRLRLDAVSALGALANQFAPDLVEAGCVEPLLNFSIKDLEDSMETEAEERKAHEVQLLAVRTLSLLSSFPMTQRKVVEGLCRRLVTQSISKALPKDGTSTVGGRTATSVVGLGEVPEKRPQSAGIPSAAAKGQLKGRLKISQYASRGPSARASAGGKPQKGHGVAPPHVYAGPPVPMQNMGDSFKFKAARPPDFAPADVNESLLGGGKHAAALKAADEAGKRAKKPKPPKTPQEREADRRERVASLVIMLCRNEDNVAAISRSLEFAEITSLVDMCRENHPKRQALAAELLEIAAERSRLAMAGAGGIPTFVELAIHGNEEKVRERMIKILRKLTAYGEHRAEIVRQLAKKVAHTEGNDAKLQAARVLIGLKAVQSDNRSGVVRVVEETAGHLLTLAVSLGASEEAREATRLLLFQLVVTNPVYRKAVIGGLMLRLAGGRRSRAVLAAQAVAHLAHADMVANSAGGGGEGGGGAEEAIFFNPALCRAILHAKAVPLLAELATAGGVDYTYPSDHPRGGPGGYHLALKGVLAVGASWALRALWCLCAFEPHGPEAALMGRDPTDESRHVAYEMLWRTCPASVDKRNTAADPEEAVNRVALALDECSQADLAKDPPRLAEALKALDGALGGVAGAGEAEGAEAAGVRRARRLFSPEPGGWGVVWAVTMLERPDVVEEAVSLGTVEPLGVGQGEEEGSAGPGKLPEATRPERGVSAATAAAALKIQDDEEYIKELIRRVFDKAIAFAM